MHHMPRASCFPPLSSIFFIATLFISFDFIILEVIIPSPPHLKRAHIVVVQGGEPGRRVVLGPEATLLGRDQIAPGELQVSRHHMSIIPRGDQLWLEDTSLNGTWVNGDRVFGQVPIKAGDEIVVGNYVLRVE